MPYLRIAIRNLWASQTRTLILGGAIASVTLILVVLLSLTTGIRRTMLDNSMSLMTGHVNLAGFYKISQTSAAPMVTNYLPLLELAKQTVPEARLIIDRVKAYGSVISDTGRIQVPLWGVNMRQEGEILGKLLRAKKRDYFDEATLKASDAAGESEFEGDIKDLENPGTFVIFASQAKKLGVRVGDSVTISMPTYRNVSNTVDVKIVAVLQDMGLFSSFSAYLNHQDVRRLSQIGNDVTGQIMIYLPSEKTTTKVENRLREAVGKAGYAMMAKDENPFWLKFEKVVSESWKGQKIDVTTWEDETSFMKWILNIFNALTFVMTAVLLFIVALGLTNTLWISVRERTGEIGTLRAIGMQRGQVMKLFLLEAFVLSLFSVMVGILSGALLVSLLNWIAIPIRNDAFQLFLMSQQLSFRIDGVAMIGVLFVITLCLMIGAWLPSRRASKLKPISAMQTVE